ncbi:MAG: succinylglutamate desuccinylase/aspartoacylase family protein [Alphaproteobacteria bacterium]|nr:succinylglutamate desuccinylase/aspartoacylase family protein [Alphaproteobacteria bacterium]
MPDAKPDARAASRSKVSATVDIERSGRQVGHLAVPHSRDDSAWGAVRVPIAVFKNGKGPTVLLTAGNHGDEYEGQIALRKLIRSLDPSAIQGRVIVMPALNGPAVEAGRRLSPIDGVNMNRAFPGIRDGSVTRMIAHYVHSELLPHVDAALDMHSGGKTLHFSPLAAIHALDDPGLMARTRAAMLAFAAPIALVLRELDAEGMLDTAVEDLGKVFVSTELGGGGTTSTATIAIAERGVQNLLKHLAILAGRPETRESLGLPPTRLMRTPDQGYVIADDAGLLEMLVDLDQKVRAGQPVAQVYRLDRPSEAPVAYPARVDGVLIGRAHQCLVKPGDFVGLVAQAE